MRYSLFATYVLLLIFLLSGCAAPQNQGRIIRSDEVNHMVESGIVLPGHTYYYTGPEIEPDAIIAIANSYTLKSKYWIKVENVSESLHDWNRIIDNAYRYRYRNVYEGSWIITPGGNKAGFWYSKYGHSVIHFPDDSSIIIYTPFVPFETEPPFFKRAE